MPLISTLFFSVEISVDIGLDYEFAGFIDCLVAKLTIDCHKYSQ